MAQANIVSSIKSIQVRGCFRQPPWVEGRAGILRNIGHSELDIHEAQVGRASKPNDVMSEMAGIVQGMCSNDFTVRERSVEMLRSICEVEPGVIDKSVAIHGALEKIWEVMLSPQPREAEAGNAAFFRLAEENFATPQGTNTSWIRGIGVLADSLRNGNTLAFREGAMGNVSRILGAIEDDLINAGMRHAPEKTAFVTYMLAEAGADISRLGDVLASSMISSTDDAARNYLHLALSLIPKNGNIEAAFFALDPIPASGPMYDLLQKSQPRLIAIAGKLSRKEDVSSADAEFVAGFMRCLDRSGAFGKVVDTPIDPVRGNFIFGITGENAELRREKYAEFADAMRNGGYCLSMYGAKRDTTELDFTPGLKDSAEDCVLYIRQISGHLDRHDWKVSG
jgi:hypothetical protein